MKTQNAELQEEDSFRGVRFMDIQNVGVSSTIPQIRAAGGDLSQAEVSFGVSTWANWPTLLSEDSWASVYIDTNNDGQSEYRLETQGNTDEYGSPILDYPLVEVQQFRDGDWITVNTAPLNGLQGNVDSNTMDTNVMLMTVKASWLGIAGNVAAPFTYFVESGPSAMGNSSTEPVEYDPVNPGLWFQGGTPVSAASNSIFYGRTGQVWTANRASGTNPKALFLHFQNRTGDLGVNGGTGQKAEIVSSRTNDDACRNAIQAAATENKLGPAAGEIVFGLRDEGCYQDFQNNASVYWSPNTGAHPVVGDIRAKWRNGTAENGPLGYPVGKEFTTRNGGKAQHFQGGIMYWNPFDKAAFSVRGKMLDAYARAGFENGSLGYPRGDEFSTKDGGKAQHFQGGIVYWNPYEKAAYSVRGEMVGAYAQYGFENGTLSYPKAEETSLSNGGKSQRFHNGTLIRDPNGNTRIQR